MRKQALEYLDSKLAVRQDSLVSHLSNGNAVDFAQYKEVCGKAAGIAIARREIAEMLETLRKGDAED